MIHTTQLTCSLRRFWISLQFGTGGKKSSVHVATPYPVKQAKTAANKPNQSTPKSAGSHACKSCNRYMLICSYKVSSSILKFDQCCGYTFFPSINCRTFGSEGALDSHTKAKHSSGKWWVYRELECLCIAYSPGLLISFCGSPNVKATLVSLLACSILVLESCQVGCSWVKQDLKLYSSLLYFNFGVIYFILFYFCVECP